MKRLPLLVTTAFLAVTYGHAQSLFDFDNVYAPTRIGSTDGPLAGPGIWAQMLAGASSESLAPVGIPVQHFDRGGLPTGLAFGGDLAVPNVPPYDTAFVEMLAWDGTHWGTLLSAVPKDQLGLTDVVPVVLANPDFGFLPLAPHFTQPAVVPIPEPAPLGIAAVGGLGALLFCGVWKRCSTRPVARAHGLRNAGR